MSTHNCSNAENCPEAEECEHSTPHKPIEIVKGYLCTEVEECKFVCGDTIVVWCIPIQFYLWYDNSSDYFDCASRHNTLEDAICAAKTGWQTRQHITTDSKGKNIVWRNYKENSG